MATAAYSLAGRRVWVAGSRGMAGAALLRRLRAEDCTVLTTDRTDLDLGRQGDVEAWMTAQRPDAIFLAAGRVGGIAANMAHPAAFLYDNLIIAANVIHAAHRAGVEKLLYLGSSCMYPREAEQPLAESALLSGRLEPTNEGYAVAKIAGLKLCQAYRHEYGADFITAIPTNLYGSGDTFHPENSHVPAALLHRFHEAKMAQAGTAMVWGSGRPRREFLHVDDMADACVHLMTRYSAPEPVNVGTGEDLSIAAFAELVKEVVGFRGSLVFDSDRPDGMPRKVLDVSRLSALGWRARIPLRQGLEHAYAWFLTNVAPVSGRRRTADTAPSRA